MSVPSLTPLAAQCGAAVTLSRGGVLRIVAVEDEQVADLALFARSDTRDAFSPGRTIDYHGRIDVRLGTTFFSHRSTPLARVVEDSVGVHDILLSPCSRVMFERRGEFDHRSCHANLVEALEPYGVRADDVTATVNVFMDVRVAPDRAIAIHRPPARAGDCFAIEALVDLIVGITACSSEVTNAGRCKPVAFSVQS